MCCGLWISMKASSINPHFFNILRTCSLKGSRYGADPPSALQKNSKFQEKTIGHRWVKVRKPAGIITETLDFKDDPGYTYFFHRCYIEKFRQALDLELTEFTQKFEIIQKKFSQFFLIVLYTYLGYPICLYNVNKLNPKPIKKNQFLIWPAVSFLIAAKNESSRIASRISNILKQDYPSVQLALILF